MIKFNLIILVFLIQLSKVIGQIIPNWQITASWGIEKHDKRLFDYSEKESLLAMQPENWGTYNLDVNIKRKIWSKQRLNGLIGFGLEDEIATFLRPFDHSHFDKDSFRILRNLNHYSKVKLPLSLSVFYELGNHWFISGDLVSDILLFRSINHTENNSGAFPYEESSFEFDEIHFVLGINCRIKQFYAGINSRVMNYQKIDKIIFNYLIHDPRVNQKWEWYNPLRFDFKVGYMW